MITINLLGKRIQIELSDDGDGTIVSGLKEGCIYCGSIGCIYNCDESTMDSSEDQRERIQYNAAVDGLEALILALACSGMDMTSNQMVDCIQTAVDALDSHFMD